MVPITVARGDGIGPEIMDASLRILKEAGADIEIDEVMVGEKVYLTGNTSGIEPAFWDSIRRTKVFYKAPLTTPQGGGYKSINVTTRKTLSLYANVRPARSLHPFVETKHPKQNLVVVRENEEDLYAGIEHRQTDEVYQCLKLISRPGSERIIRYAFEYAKANNRQKVTCFTKDNIMKLTDGLFHDVFDEVAAEYPDVENEHWIVDIGAAKMADAPENFDVLVLPNLYGDVLSDVAAQIAGSVGMAGSANIGEHAAMFEAIHGSAPRRAGQNLANPSGLLQGGIMMLVHIGQSEVAERVHNAWLRTIEEGIHTYDIFREGVSKQKVGTKEFADAVIGRLGKQPETLQPVSYAGSAGVPAATSAARRKPAERVLKGADIFLSWDERDRSPEVLGETLSKANSDRVKLTMITNRGLKVWPKGAPETFCTDHWRCRFEGATDGVQLKPQDIIDAQQRVLQNGFDIIKTENLYTFDGVPGYSLGQGQ
ncbi:MAG: NADP-dependent isocitrate dehydrogenase [Spirochaetales bacterium]|nr:NADP-dependent isocitrate dehydrogenase [Spirochaetales bacterium]